MADGTPRPRDPRELARQNLIAFQCGASRAYRPGLQHQVVATVLNEVAAGRIDRVLFEAPPRHGKTRQIGVDFPAHFLGNNPEKQIAYTTYAQDRANDVGLEVRNLVSSEYYASVFPGITINARRNAAKRFSLNRPYAGGYQAVGIGGPLTGRGADLLVMDDTIKDRVMADSPKSQRRAREWYSSVAYTRLEPGARIVSMMCMVGETPVLMADGTERQIADIRPGDVVASHESGRLVSSRVLNWKSQGDDLVYEITMKSGRIVRANERHPFLVDHEGLQSWVRLRELRLGDRLVALHGGLCEACSALSKGAESALVAKACATPTTARNAGMKDIARHPRAQTPGAEHVSATGTESPQNNTHPCSPSSMGAAQSARHPRSNASGPGIGTPCASTTTTKHKQCAACSATGATSPSQDCPQRCLKEPLSTYGLTVDSIAEIREDGRAEVFDIQVERTENFIANGLVSHNTRWADNDLHGHIEREHTADGWLVVRLPALGGPGDFLARPAGTPLWPERWGRTQLERIRNTLMARDWLALYQQAPSALEGSEFKRDWFRRYINTPSKMTIYGSTDYAVTGDGGDWTVLLVWGIDHLGEAYLLDAWREQKTSDEWAEMQLKMQKKWRCMAWFGEAGPIRSSVEPFLRMRAKELKIFPYLVWLPSITDKVSRARSFQARAAMGMIHLPYSQVANHGLEELCSFPTGSTDDFVDACTVFGRGLDMVVAALAANGQDSPGPKPFTAEWLEYEESKNAFRLY